MNDLQDLIDQWGDGLTLAARAYPETFMAGFLDAARRVANPDIEAAAMERHRNGRPKCYEGPKEDGCYCWITTEKAVDLALGITEDE